jgi:hypothetical protein
MGSNADATNQVDPSPAKAGLWEDFVDIFYTPSSVFARRSDGKFGLALLLLVVIGTVLFFVTKNAMAPIMDAEFARQSAAAMRKNPNITAEQMASGRSFFEVAAPLFFAVGLTISVFGTGLVLWVVGKLFDAKESVAAAIMIATYSEVPRIVQILTNAAQGLVMSPEKLNSLNAVGFNLARFMNPDTASPVAIALPVEWTCSPSGLRCCSRSGCTWLGRFRRRRRRSRRGSRGWSVRCRPCLERSELADFQ